MVSSPLQELVGGLCCGLNTFWVCVTCPPNMVAGCELLSSLVCDMFFFWLT